MAELAGFLTFYPENATVSGKKAVALFTNKKRKLLAPSFMCKQ